MEDKIKIKGAKTHNLKDIDLEIPRNKMVVFTGVSGSGKSSLAFDTIFAEGQRRYVESLSPYARQFLRQAQSPDVEEISGLSPAISIAQKSRSSNPRSTVATITEIYDYLRVLFARVGKPYCPKCGREIKKLSREEMFNLILKSIEKGDAKKSNEDLSNADYNNSVVKIFAPVVSGRKGEYYQLLYDLLGAGYEKVKVDGELKNLRERITLLKNKKHNIDALVDEIYVSELKKESVGIERLQEAVEVSLERTNGLTKVEYPNEKERILSANFMCPYDGFSFPEVEPRLFSFNSPKGACPACNGLGTKYFWSNEECPLCKGARLKEEALFIYLHSKIGEKTKKKNIVNVTALSVREAQKFFKNIVFSEKEKEIVAPVIKEIVERLEFMENVGLEYITLDRKAGTISGGESQRIRLASQLGSGLVGSLYVLDEPTIGLHKKDNDRLIKTLTALRDLGNTIIVVEHDEDTIYSSDYLVDLGPGAGVFGGEVVVSGDVEKLLTQKKVSNSMTLSYLRGEENINLPEKRRTQDKGVLKVRGGKKFNIKNMNVDIPLSRLNVVTGVSGSGKSTFIYEILLKNLRAKLDKKYRRPDVFNCKKFTGYEYLARAISINQAPIGKTPRSNPATYTGTFTYIRELFSATKEAKARGYKPGRFSFNVKGGRCEACQGKGMISVGMHFLPTMYVACDVCGGKRFSKETLEVKYKGKNIYEVLEMTIEEACYFFDDIAPIYDRLKTLYDVGLGYLKLGQSATTLSGGESQRVKIASELFGVQLKKTIYFLDEPTVGLHYEDIKKLLDVLQSLIKRGNTVVILEHNMDVIKSADYIIDIGPEGGEAGGKIVAKGTPEEVAQNKNSITGSYLKKYLNFAPFTKKRVKGAE